MGPSAVTTEGFIFEVETQKDGVVILTVDGVEYPLAAAICLRLRGLSNWKKKPVSWLKIASNSQTIIDRPMVA